MSDASRSRTSLPGRTAVAAGGDRASHGYWDDLFATAGQGWNRFWFRPADPLPLSIMRIGVGLVAALFFFSFTQDLVLWFGPDGLLPMDSVEALVLEDANAHLHRFSIFYGIESPAMMAAAHWTCVVVALLFAAGLLTRVTGLVMVVGVLSYIHRIPIITTPVAPVLSMLVVYLTLGPAGRYFSLDRWLWPRRPTVSAGDERSLLANIAIRLLQIHFAALVLAMGLSKLGSFAWWDGESVWHLIAQTISRPVDLTGLRPYTFLVNGWTHAIVYFELVFPVLIWNRLARPLLLPIGFAIWASIGLLTGMLMFSLAMMLGALCYVPASTWRRWGIDPR